MKLAYYAATSIAQIGGAGFLVSCQAPALSIGVLLVSAGVQSVIAWRLWRSKR